MTSASTRAQTGEDLYQGLLPFGEEDAARFHGRSTEMEELARLIRSAPAVLVFGVSGIGKTSLLQAGVFPQLREQGFLPIPVRLLRSDRSGSPKRQVVEAIARAIERGKIDAEPPSEDMTLWEYFHRTPFWSAANDLVTPVLVLDQFEEVFTRWGDSAEDKLRVQALLVEVTDLVQNTIPKALESLVLGGHEDYAFDIGRQRVRVLFVIREDHLPDFHDIGQRMSALGDNRYRLRPLKGDQAIAAVMEPARGRMTEALAARIVRFVAKGEEGDQVDLADLRVEPSLLSLFCQELNQSRIEAGSDEFTDAVFVSQAREGFFERFYERCLEDMPLSARIFIEEELLTPRGKRSGESLDKATTDYQIPVEVIDALVDQRLLRTLEAFGDRHLELVHDRLTGVVEASRDRRRADEDRRRLIWKLLGLGATAVVLVAVVLGVVLWLNDRAANEALTTEKQKLEVANADLEVKRTALATAKSEVEEQAEQLRSSNQALGAKGVELETANTELKTNRDQLAAAKDALELVNEKVERAVRAASVRLADLYLQKGLEASGADEYETAAARFAKSNTYFPSIRARLELARALDQFETDPEQIVRTIETPPARFAVSVRSPPGDSTLRVAVADSTGQQVRIYRVGTHRPLTFVNTEPSTEPILSLSLSADGSRLLVVRADRASVWNTDTQAAVGTYAGAALDGHSISGGMFGPTTGDVYLLTARAGSPEGDVLRLKGDLTPSDPGTASRVPVGRGFMLDPSESTLAVLADGRRVRLLDAADFAFRSDVFLENVQGAESARISTLDVRDGGDVAAVGLSNGVVLVVDVTTGGELVRFHVGDEPVRSVALGGPGGKLLATVCGPNLDIRHLASEDAVLSFSVPETGVEKIVFSADGQLLLVPIDTGLVEVPLRELRAIFGPPRRVANSVLNLIGRETYNEANRGLMSVEGETKLALLAAMDSDATALRRAVLLGNDLECTDAYRRCPLHIVVDNGFVEGVRILLDAGVDPDAQELEGETALHSAAWQGNVEMIRLLAEAGADVNVREQTGWVPIQMAVQAGEHAAVAALLAHGAWINEADDEGWTALHKACRNGILEIVRLLVERGATPDGRSVSGLRPLSVAAQNGHVEVVRLLAEHVDVNAANDRNWSALHAATWDGHAQVVEVLLDQGADIDGADSDGRTALHAAITQRHEELARALIERGARLDVSDQDGETPLHKAVWGELWSVAEQIVAKAPERAEDPSNQGDSALLLAVQTVLRATSGLTDTETSASDSGTAPSAESLVAREAFVRTLLAAGVDPSSPNGRGLTALHFASRAGDGGEDSASMVRILLEAGADPIARDERGWIPIHEAAATGHDAALTLYLERDPDLELADTEGDNALHKAVIGDHLETAKLLLEAGSNVDARSEFGRLTPLHYAAASGNAEIVKLLLDHGADIDLADVEGWTALHKSLGRNHPLVTDLLLMRGASPELPNEDGRSAVHLAAMYGRVDVISRLKEAGADLARPDNDGFVSLHFAANNGEALTVRLLLEAGVPVDAAGGERKLTPLHVAARQEDTVTIGLLLGAGAAVENPDSLGWTALHHAAWHERAAVAKMLLDAGADVDAVTNEGKQPTDLAEQDDVLAVLRAAGGG